MKLTPERGFRRVTALLSFILLLVGLTLAAMSWEARRQAWSEALLQPKTESLAVKVVGGKTYLFSREFSEPALAEAIEEIRRGETTEVSAGAGGFSRHEGVPLSFVYRPDTITKQIDALPIGGHMYSVRELLERDAEGRLPADVKKTLDELRNETPPRISPVSRPTFWNLLGSLRTAVASACAPWLLFWIGSWIVRGFTEGKPGES